MQCIYCDTGNIVKLMLVVHRCRQNFIGKNAVGDYIGCTDSVLKIKRKIVTKLEGLLRSILNIVKYYLLTILVCYQAILNHN